MTVSSAVNRNDYAGNGSTTNFAVSFRFLQNSDVKATLRDASGGETLQVETTNYTLTGAGDAGGGTLVMLVPPPSGETLTILRDVPATQETDYVENDEFPAESHEDALDKLTMLVQQQAEDSTRHLGFSETVSDATGSAIELSQDSTQRADKFLGFDSAGDLVTKTALEAGVVDQNKFDKRYGPVFETSAAMIAASPVAVDGSTVTLVAGMTVHVQTDWKTYLVKSAAQSSTDGDLVNETVNFTADNGTILVFQVSNGDELPVEINMTNTQSFYDGVRELDKNPPVIPHVAFTGYGDSVASQTYVLGNMALAMMLRYGIGGAFTPNFGYTWSGAAWTLAGGATQPLTDFQYLPGANQIVMPIGATAETTMGSLTFGSSTMNAGAYPNSVRPGRLLDVRTVDFYYITKPGAGTLTFEVVQTGETYTPVVVDTNAALGVSKSSITILAPQKSISIKTTASVAENLYIGSLFKRDKGVLFWLSQVGGSTMTNQNLYITNGNVSTTYTDLFDLLTTRLIIHNQRVPPDANWEANYNVVFDALDSFDADQLILGEAPNEVISSPTVPEINTFLRNQAVAREYPFYDQNQAFGGDTAKMTKLGWGGSDVHLLAPAWRYLSGKILEAMDWTRMGLSELEIDPLTQRVQSKDRLRFLSLHETRSNRVSGSKVAVADGIVLTGGFTNVNTNERGYVLTSAAANGGAAMRPGVVAIGPRTEVSTDFAIALTGFRNMTLVADLRAYMVFGTGGTTITTLTSLVGGGITCFGIEFAFEADVQTPTAGFNIVCRLFTCDGVTINNGNWVKPLNPGSAGFSTNGLNMSLIWSKDAERFDLYSGNGQENIVPVTQLEIPGFSSLLTIGPWINMGLVAEGGIPVGTGNFSLLEITNMWGPNETGLAFHPYGIAT